MIATPQTQPPGIGGFSQTVYYTASEDDFFSPTLDDYQPPHFPILSQTDPLIDMLLRQRLVFLAGDPLVKKYPLACYLAWHLQKQLSRPNTGIAATQVHVREWLGSSDEFVDRRLERFIEPTIFILPGLLPQHIDYDVQRLRKALHDTHYAIVIVEEQTPWKQSQREDLRALYWNELSPNGIYTTKDLVMFLITYARGEQGILQRIIQKDARQNLLIGGRRIDHVVSQLKTPERIEDFVRHLSAYARSGLVTTQHVQESITAVQRNHNPLLEWYYRLREPRRQLLALAICFFDGLYEQQFFAAVDCLIDQAWRQRDTLWRAIDYDDLAPLERFYEFVPLASGGKIIKTRSREQRRMLLTIVWERHRRSLVSALPVFYHCIKQSIEAPHTNIELYGSKELNAQIRSTLGDTLSDIGLQDTNVVAPFLLRLAIDSQIGIQTVAARAIARWRGHGSHQQAFDVLVAWTSPSITDVVISIAEPIRSGAQERLAQLSETVALTIGYAGRVDSPNRMARVLVEILTRQVQGGEIHVLQYLASYTIPMLVPLHLRQIQRIVFELITHDTVRGSLVNCLLQAYSKQPHDVLDMVDHWCDTCLDLLANEAYPQLLEKWVNVLVCLCDIYSQLPHSSAEIKPLLGRMQCILEMVEHHKHLRTAALSIFLQHVRINLSALQDIIPSLTAHERRRVIQWCVEIYDEQRTWQATNVVGGLASGSYHPSTWTPIERELLRWIKDWRNPSAQRMAIRVCAALLRSQYPHLRSQAGQPPPQVEEFSFIPWIVTIREVQYRAIISVLLPELVLLYRRNSELTKHLLSLWLAYPDPMINELARLLRIALFGVYFKDHRSPILFAIIGAVVLLFLLIVIF